MGRIAARTSALNVGLGPQTAGLIDPLGIWGPADVPFDFDLNQIVFAAGMDKRLAPGPFYTAPIVQGDLDGTGVPDVLSFPRGDLLANQTQYFYSNIDPYQGSIVFWITPEWDGDDGIAHQIFDAGTGADVVLQKNDASSLRLFVGGQSTLVDVSAWVAGTTYFVVARWDQKNTLDGTNYASLTVNNVHTFGITTQPTVSEPGIDIDIGSNAGTLSADAIIEGLTLLRRPITDGDGFGTNIGVLDEIEDIYAAGAGADPTLITGGAFDITACFPTNSTDEELVTGPGEMWSMPHADSIPDVTFNSDGGLPGTPFATEYNATTTDLNCGSDVDIDDIADAEFTAEAWIRADSWGEGDNGNIIGKTGSAARGWAFVVLDTAGIRAAVVCATTAAISESGLDEFTLDGKWHHVTMYFNDAGDRKIYLAIDGRWATSYATQDAGVGAIVSDAGDDLIIGNNSADARTFDGGIAWAAISNNDRHTVGTDFIAPRAFPADDANYLASWEMDEGTGALVANTGNQGGGGSGAANRDGTLTNGLWSSIWEQELTPVVPQSVEFNATTTGINCGSDVDIDDIMDAEATVEAWIRADGVGEGGFGRIVVKEGDGTVGWRVFLTATGIAATVLCGATNASSAISVSLVDGIWHHVAMHWDDALVGAARVISLAFDGVWAAAYDTQTPGVGAITTDVAEDLIIGQKAGGAYTFDGGIGWTAISNNDRHTVGATFVPPSRCNPPGDDANYLALWPFTDGAGTTLDNIGNQGGGGSGAANRDGTITDGVWNNTPDMAVDEPGARAFNNGYNIGSDGASDGITDIETVVAETDYVIRTFLSYGQSGRAWPEIYLWDNVGAAQIGVTYPLPRMHDVHTGGAASAVLVNANGSFTQQLIGWLAYNIDDGSVGTITAVSGDGTTITAPLAGGGSDDWQNGEEYVLRPPGNAPYARYPVATEGIFVFRTPAACVSMDIKVRNAAGEGVMQVHQCEVYESLIVNGDHESLNGGFPGAAELITAWTNLGLGAGDTQPSSGGGNVIHAGAEAMQWNAGAIASEGMYDNDYTGAPGVFVAIGGWFYGTGAADLTIGTQSNTRAPAQYDPTVISIPTNIGAYWQHQAYVGRQNSGAGIKLRPTMRGAAAGPCYSDDMYMVLLDFITITVTPANQANSLEGAGIRIDGHDQGPQPVNLALVTANSGWVRWNTTFRHGDTEAVLFGHVAPTIMIIWGDANNYFYVSWGAADTITMLFNANGAGIQFVNWATGGAYFIPGTIHLFEVRWTGTRMRLYIDGVIQGTINAVTGFVWPVGTTAWWGTSRVGVNQVDAVFSPVG